MPVVEGCFGVVMEEVEKGSFNGESSSNLGPLVATIGVETGPPE